MSTTTTKAPSSTPNGDGEFSLWDADSESNSAAQYLQMVRQSIGGPEFQLDADQVRRAIISVCAFQIGRDGQVDTPSFAWLLQHPSVRLDTLFPGHRPESHDPEKFPSSLGRFVLLAVLGSGGFATVYLAIDLKYQRRVALKTLHSGPNAGERPRKSILAEAEVLRETNCANVVRVYGIYEISRETVIAMQLIEGINLSVILKDEVCWNASKLRK